MVGWAARAYRDRMVARFTGILRRSSRLRTPLPRRREQQPPDRRCMSAGNESADADIVAEEPGYLVVVCQPACDEVTADNHSLGPSPVIRAPMKPGKHHILLRAGALTKEITTDVVAGHTAAQRVSMDQAAAESPR